MNALLLFCTGVILMFSSLSLEELPKWLRTIVWATFIIVGVVAGALSAIPKV